jgi:hypothetical protein
VHEQAGCELKQSVIGMSRMHAGCAQSGVKHPGVLACVSDGFCCAMQHSCKHA